MTYPERCAATPSRVLLSHDQAGTGALGNLCDLGRALAAEGKTTMVVEWPAGVCGSAAALAGLVEVHLQLGALIKVEWAGLLPDLIAGLSDFGFDPVVLAPPDIAVASALATSAALVEPVALPDQPSPPAIHTPQPAVAGALSLGGNRLAPGWWQRGRTRHVTGIHPT